MEHINITNEQIEAIRKNIKSRGIESTDLEYEMVDHIATAVEEKLNENKNFYDAYKEVMLTFGPYGMSKMQREHKNKLFKQGFFIFLKYFKSFFTIPKVVLTIAIYLACYKIYSIGPARLFEYFFKANGLISIFIYAFIAFKYRKTKFIQLSFIQGLYYGMLGYPSFVFAYSLKTEFYTEPYICTSITTLIIVFQLVMFKMYHETIQQLINKYTYAIK